MKTRKAVIVGSTNFPLDTAVVTQVVEILRGLGQGTLILTRGSDGLDQFIMAAATVLGMRCFTYPSEGGRDNWVRDVEMVRDGTEVHGFLSLEDFERADKMSGTMHVIEQGLNAKRPTKAYVVVDGTLITAGET
jgi:hypothetical protein